MLVEEFKALKKWAVVGSVHNQDKFAYKIYKNLKSKGFEVYPVDPSGKEVDGEPTYKSIGALPIVPDAVDMVINPVKGEAFVDETMELGIKYIWFQPGAQSDEIIAKAQNYELKVIHDKCIMVEF